MAKECPRCHRPNSDQAAKCVYCSAALTSAETFGARLTPAAKPKSPEPPEAFLVILSPVAKTDPKWLRPFCELTGLDPYLAKQRCKSPVPWVVRVFPEQEPAQQFLGELTALGLEAYLLKQSGLRKLESKLEVRSLGPREDGWSFGTAAGDEVVVRYAELFLIVRGRIQVQPEREDTAEQPVEVNLGGLIVGAPGEEEEKPEDPLVRLKRQARRIKVHPKERHLRMAFRRHEAEVMDLYLQTSRVGIRLIENEFDFSGLGQRKVPSALLNFLTVYRDLLEHAPQALHDEYFKRISYVLEEGGGKDEMRTQLQDLGLSSSAKKLYDNKAFFTDYSSRIYLHYLRQAQKEKNSPAAEPSDPPQPAPASD